MSPIERAARAVGDTVSALPSAENNREIVRAVLTAIREPSDEMVGAGAQVDAWVQHEGQAPQPEVFTAMIDALLEEGK